MCCKLHLFPNDEAYQTEKHKGTSERHEKRMAESEAVSVDMGRFADDDIGEEAEKKEEKTADDHAYGGMMLPEANIERFVCSMSWRRRVITRNRIPSEYIEHDRCREYECEREILPFEKLQRSSKGPEEP